MGMGLRRVEELVLELCVVSDRFPKYYLYDITRIFKKMKGFSMESDVF